ncbi:MAG: hypothetical protein H6644_15270 [Caldilineaceae bacterium]|nr:hypothetical protein [Caldilineaceae bacterium]
MNPSASLATFILIDLFWIIPALVAGNRPRLFGRKVLIAPQAITGQNQDDEFETKLTQEDYGTKALTSLSTISSAAA